MGYIYMWCIQSSSEQGVGAGSSGGAQASANARALQSVPEEGAMRGLLEYALKAASQPGVYEALCTFTMCLAISVMQCTELHGPHYILYNT